MLENLLKTWEILASNEVRNDAWGQVWLNDSYTASIHIEPSSDDSFLPWKKFVLQGYIQRCIESRGWTWSLGFEANPSESFYEAIVRISENRSSLVFSKSAVIAILAVYLRALAAQRPITPGQWQHFKGDVVEVLGEAHWDIGRYCGELGEQCLPLVEAEFIGSYRIEEKLDKFLSLYKCKNNNDFLYISEYESDHANRVFYSCNGQKKARKTDVFLGLIGAEYPGSEGLLRFAEVAK